MIRDKFQIVTITANVQRQLNSLYRGYPPSETTEDKVRDPSKTHTDSMKIQYLAQKQLS